jgi:methyl-accepting chemotaxis protein
LVEEAAAAAESLVEQSVNLMDTVNEFKLKGGESYDRRTSNSAMRTTSRTVAAKASSKPAPATVMAKTGTDDGAWEEF